MDCHDYGVLDQMLECKTIKEIKKLLEARWMA